MLNVECGVPPVLTFVSLLVCVVALLRSAAFIFIVPSITIVNDKPFIRFYIIFYT